VGARRYLAILGWIVALVLGIGYLNKETIIVQEPLRIHQIQFPSISGKPFGDIVLAKGEELGDFQDVDFTFGRPFSAEDTKLAILAVRFVENLTGDKYDMNFQNLYWSDDMLTKNPGLLGMTVFRGKLTPWNAYVAVAKEIKPTDTRDLNKMRDFASVLIHEWEHAKNIGQEQLVRHKINMTIELYFDYAYHVAYTNLFPEKVENSVEKPYHLLLEKAAHDAGILPPYFYVHDFTGSEMGGTLRDLRGLPAHKRYEHIH
jgi:hypothetical protein